MNNDFSLLKKKSIVVHLSVLLCLLLLGLFSSHILIVALTPWLFEIFNNYMYSVILSIASIGTFLFPSWVWVILMEDKFKTYLKINLPKRKNMFLWSFVLVFVSLPFVQYIAFLNQQIPLPSSLMDLEKKASEQLKFLLEFRTPTAMFINIIVIGILPAIVEELFFRSVLQRTIYDFTKKIWLSIFIAAFIFSFFHLQFQGFFPRLVLGIFLGIIFHYSNSILPSMLFHATFNSFQLILYYTLNVDLDKINQQDINTWSLLALATISLYIVYVIFSRKFLLPFLSKT